MGFLFGLISAPAKVIGLIVVQGGRVFIIPVGAASNPYGFLALLAMAGVAAVFGSILPSGSDPEKLTDKELAGHHHFEHLRRGRRDNIKNDVAPAPKVGKNTLTLEILAVRSPVMDSETTELTFERAGHPTVRQTIRLSAEQPELLVKVVLPGPGSYMVKAVGTVDLFLEKTRRLPIESQGVIEFTQNDRLRYVRQLLPDGRKCTAGLMK